MNFRRYLTRSIGISALVLGLAQAGHAQTTVTITGTSAVQDTAIRGGTYAAVNFDGQLLVTRASSDSTYVRRSLLDFDTSSTIPVGAVIQSATLTMTVHSGGTMTPRRVGVYPVTRAFTASQATWDVASATTAWTTPGGDLGAQAAVGLVPNTAGSQAHFDVTALVQANVKSSGSRRTRVALLDADSLTTGRDGYRDYYQSEATNTSVRPVLTVRYGASAAVPNFTHVFVIVMENKEYGSIIGNSAAPYINSLANTYGLATNYTAVSHPSLPNYMALTGGQTFFTTDCSGCVVSATNVADQVYNSGRTWKGFFEGMPAPCTTTDSGQYVQKHNPFIHYSDIVTNTTRCHNHLLPLTSFYTELTNGTLPNYVWITPDVCNDMHNCSVAAGDAWLANFIPQIINSSSFTNSVVLLVWDEGTTTTGGGGHVPLIVVSPRTPAGYRSATAYNHYSLLRTIEAAWGMPALGNTSSAVPMAEFFR